MGESGRAHHVVLEHDGVGVLLLEQHAVERPLVVLRQVGLPLLTLREQRHAWPLPQRHVEPARHRRRRRVVAILRDVDRHHRGALDAEKRRERLLKVLGPVVAQEEHGGVLQRQEPVLRVVSASMVDRERLCGWRGRRGRQHLLPPPSDAGVLQRLPQPIFAAAP